MCHIILLLPLLAIPLFWLLPLPIALSAYTFVLVVSAGVYFLALRAMHRPVQNGVESLLRSTGNVTGRQGERYRVRVMSEDWTADSADRLQPGDRVEVIAVHNLRLRVRRIDG